MAAKPQASSGRTDFKIIGPRLNRQDGVDRVTGSEINGVDDVPGPGHPYGVRMAPIVAPPEAVDNAIHAVIGTRTGVPRISPARDLEALWSRTGDGRA